MCIDDLHAHIVRLAWGKGLPWRGLRPCQGRAVPRRFQDTVKLDRFPQGADAALRPIRDLIDSVSSGLK
ncbi:MAG: hypothetical protein HY660_09320 [Armatimonadetes bacterium]|nr:hypothetical protein [Armatimonadota bacterium]